MVVPFAFLSVGRGAWLKYTIRWNALLFEWRDFSTKPCSCKGTDYWSTSLWTLPFLLTEQPFSLLVAQYQLLKDIHIAAHLRVLCSPHPIFLTLPPLSSFVIFWAVVESLLLSYSITCVARIILSLDRQKLHYHCAYQFWNRCFPLWLLEACHMLCHEDRF